MLLEVIDTDVCAGDKNANSALKSGKCRITILRFQFPSTLLEALAKPQFLMNEMD